MNVDNIPDQKSTISVQLGESTAKRSLAAGNYTGSGIYSSELGDGESATVSGIPPGTKYNVSEAASEEYESNIADSSGTITSDKSIRVIDTYRDLQSEKLSWAPAVKKR